MGGGGGGGGRGGRGVGAWVKFYFLFFRTTQKLY